jgi:hypothetical protein
VTRDIVIRIAGVVSVALLLAGVAVAAATVASEEPTDPAPMWAETMKDGATAKGRDAMREFMKSQRAPEAMASMMEMAPPWAAATSCSTRHG